MALAISIFRIEFTDLPANDISICEVEVWGYSRNVVLNQGVSTHPDNDGDGANLNDGDTGTCARLGDTTDVALDTDAPDVFVVDYYRVYLGLGAEPPDNIELSVELYNSDENEFHFVPPVTTTTWDGWRQFDGPFEFPSSDALVVDPGVSTVTDTDPGRIPPQVTDAGISCASICVPGLPRGAALVLDAGISCASLCDAGFVIRAAQVDDPGIGCATVCGAPWVRVDPAVGTQVTTIYKCTIEREGDHGSAIVTPIQSFQTRLQDTDPTWLQVVAPNIIDLQAEIEDRIDGIVRVYQGTRDQDGNETWQELAWCNLTQYQIQIGADSSVAILGGHGSEATTAPKTVALADISYEANNAGARQVRAMPNRDLRPGDTAVWPGGNMVASQVQHSIGQASSQMDVFESVTDG